VVPADLVVQEVPGVEVAAAVPIRNPKISKISHHLKPSPARERVFSLPPRGPGS